MVRVGINEIIANQLVKTVDDFNRADSNTIGNGWGKTDISSSQYPTPLRIKNNAVSCLASGGEVQSGIIYKNIVNCLEYDVYAEIIFTFNSGTWSTMNRFSFVLFGDKTNIAYQTGVPPTGIGVSVSSSAPNLDVQFSVKGTSVFSAPSAMTFSYGDRISYRARITRAGSIKAKIWLTINSEPTNWQYIYIAPTAPVGLFNNNDIIAYMEAQTANGSSGETDLDFISVTNKNSMLLNFFLPSQSGNKLTTSVALPVADSANETPTVSGLAGYLG
ncbi:hypothetical protein NO1_0596 [Candidatus Termititenax aidoneus]|uniref:Uncharacterized protein n=1 Tax=Termititenax aidoneus TaxID=2218524 RepID=A0A388T9V5_TERA1|nr:hypothetical protein NO1_0596 [Candidatus Termititenax aidoneus]